MGKYQKNIEAARRISVVQYLETYHPGELVRKTDKEYCTKTHSSLVITPANGLFHWFSQSKGGNNALDYLVKVEGMDFVSAVRLLNEMTPMPVSVQTAKAAPVQQQTSRPFVLPPADRNAEVATAYLMHRGISPKVLSYMESEGCTPSLSQAQKLKEASKESVLTPEKIQHIMAAKPPSVKPRDPQLMIPVAKVERYFPKGFTSDQMQQVIVKLLENYARAHQHGSR